MPWWVKTKGVYILLECTPIHEECFLYLNHDDLQTKFYSPGAKHILTKTLSIVIYYIMKMRPNVNLIILASNHILELEKNREEKHHAWSYFLCQLSLSSQGLNILCLWEFCFWKSTSLLPLFIFFYGYI